MEEEREKWGKNAFNRSSTTFAALGAIAAGIELARENSNGGVTLGWTAPPLRSAVDNSWSGRRHACHELRCNAHGGGRWAHVHGRGTGLRRLFVA